MWRSPERETPKSHNDGDSYWRAYNDGVIDAVKHMTKKCSFEKLENYGSHAAKLMLPTCTMMGVLCCEVSGHKCRIAEDQRKIDIG